MSPVVPDVDAPVASTDRPEAPPPVVPLLNTMRPDSPATAALPDRTITLPDAAPAPPPDPDTRSTTPPVPTAVVPPACTRSVPPTEDVLSPPRREMVPPAPSLAPARSSTLPAVEAPPAGAAPADRKMDPDVVLASVVEPEATVMSVEEARPAPRAVLVPRVPV